MNAGRIRIVTIPLLLFWLAASMGSSLAAQSQEQLKTLQSGEGPTDSTELEAFLDQLLQEQMAEHHIAGSAVSVVKDGDVL